MSAHFYMLKNLILINTSLLLSVVIGGCSVTPHEPAVVEPVVTDSILVTQRSEVHYAFPGQWPSRETCGFKVNYNAKASVCTLSRKWEDTLIGLPVDGFFSICGEGADGRRMFCLVGQPNGFSPKPGAQISPIQKLMVSGSEQTLVDGMGRVSYPSLSKLQAFTYGPGFASVTLFSHKNQGGELLCRIELKAGGRLSLCPGAVHLARSARIDGLWSGNGTRYEICFRAPLNESYRCYESRKTSTGLALINDLDSTSSYDDGYLVRSKGNTITPRLYSIDYLDRLQ